MSIFVLTTDIPNEQANYPTNNLIKEAKLGRLRVTSGPRVAS